MNRLRRSTYLQQSRRFSRNARLFLASQALAGIGSGIFSLLFNLYLVRLGFNEDVIGQVAAVSSLSIGLAAFPAGLIGDRLGRRSSLLIGGCLAGVGYLGQTLTPSAGIIMALGVVAGGGLALLAISMSPFMAENSGPDERPYLFSASFALMTLCTMVGNLIGGLLPRMFTGLLALLPDGPQPYRLALWVGVALLGVATAPFYLLRDDRRQIDRHDAVAPAVSMADTDVYRRMAIFALASATIGVAGGLIIPFFNVYFLKQFSLPAERVGLIFAVGQALMGIGQLLSPAVARRSGKAAAIVGGHFAVLPFLGILAFTGNPWVAAVAFWGRNVGINMINPIFGAFAMEMVPARLRATLSGINNMAWNTTWAVSSAIGGVLILSQGYRPAFLIAALFYALTGSVYALAFRRQLQKT
jgi:MFS family permease